MLEIVQSYWMGDQYAANQFEHLVLNMNHLARDIVLPVRIGAISGTVTFHLLAAPIDCKMIDIVLISDTETTGSDASNNYSFQIHNATGENNLLSSAYNTIGRELGADSVWRMTVDQNEEVEQDDVIQLQITKTGSPTDLSSAEVLAQVRYQRVR